MIHCYHVPVTFGDCDPAGIVFYPNSFRWMDACFHDYLRQFGGHREICAKLGSVGLGLVDAGAQFRSAMRDGDRLNIGIAALEWSGKTLTIQYEARVGDKIAFTGQEVRCLFVPSAERLTTGEMGLVRQILDGDCVRD